MNVAAKDVGLIRVGTADAAVDESGDVACREDFGSCLRVVEAAEWVLQVATENSPTLDDAAHSQDRAKKGRAHSLESSAIKISASSFVESEGDLDVCCRGVGGSSIF